MVVGRIRPPSTAGCQRVYPPGTRVLVPKINSPGGVAAGCFEAARQMRADCITAGVPVIVYADEMA